MHSIFRSIASLLVLSNAAGCFDPSNPETQSETSAASSSPSDAQSSVGVGTNEDPDTLTSSISHETSSTTSHDTISPTDTSDTTATSTATSTTTNSTTEAESCAQGAQRTCNEHPGLDGSGPCVAGTQKCVDVGGGEMQWGVCEGDIGPAAADTCDPGNDDNCNGTVNEGCSCTASDEMVCGPASVGICKSGKQTCTDGMWSTCEGAVYPKARDCSSSGDNDCDGHPDNTLDDSCQCKPAESQACDEHAGSDGKGVCKAGSQTCVAAADGASSEWGDCMGAIAPLPQDDCELSLDTNCDNALSCECTPSAKEACGACEEGERTCGVDGKWGGCEGIGGPAKTFYRDRDSDSFGDPDEDTKIVCDGSTPAGYVANADDCCDQDANVKPGQSAYFDEASSSCGNSFDYNCSDKVEVKGPASFCPTNGSCPGTSMIVDGWYGSVPSSDRCGTERPWVDCNFASPHCTFSIKNNTMVFCH